MKLIGKEIAFEAAEKVGERLIEAHINTCPGRAAAQRLEAAGENAIVRRKLGAWAHWALAAIVYGTLYAAGQWVWTKAVEMPQAAAHGHSVTAPVDP